MVAVNWTRHTFGTPATPFAEYESVDAARNPDYTGPMGGLRYGPPNVTNQSSFIDTCDDIPVSGDKVYEVEGVFAQGNLIRPFLSAQSFGGADGYRIQYEGGSALRLVVGNCTNTGTVSTSYALSNITPAVALGDYHAYGMRMRCMVWGPEVYLDLYFNNDPAVVIGGGTWHHVGKWLHVNNAFAFLGPDPANNGGGGAISVTPFLTGQGGRGIVSGEGDPAANYDAFVYERYVKVRV